MKDPSGFDLLVQNKNTELDTLVSEGLIPFEAAEKLRAQSRGILAEGAVRGWMGIKPEIAEEQLNSGKWDEYLSPGQKQELASAIRTEKRAKKAEADLYDANSKRLKQERDGQIENDFIARAVNGTLNVRDIIDSPLDARAKEHWLDRIEKEARQEVKPNGTVIAGLFDRIYLPDGDPNKITDEKELNQHFRHLGFENLQKLRNELAGKNTIQGRHENALKKSVFDTYKNQITKANPLLGIKDQDGDENYTRFLLAAKDFIEAKKKEGKTNQQIFDPDSPDYVGRIAKQFVKTRSELIKSQTQSLRNEAPKKELPPEMKIKQGEKASDYLKRIRGQ
jgi:hypothetical protein